MGKIFSFLESIDPDKCNAVYSTNGMTLLTSKEYDYRLDQIHNLTLENRLLKKKLNQLETNIAEAIKLLLDNTANYTDGDFESMRFQNDIVEILERSKE